MKELKGREVGGGEWWGGNGDERGRYGEGDSRCNVGFMCGNIKRYNRL
jgi:hypothetical protein